MNYRRVFSPEFKRESASLVLDQGYSTRETSEAVGVGTSSIRRWVRQLETERRGCHASGSVQSHDFRATQNPRTRTTNQTYRNGE